MNIELIHQWWRIALFVVTLGATASPAVLAQNTANDGVVQLHAFMAKVNTFEGEFRQRIVPPDSEHAVRTLSGSFVIERPGHLWWQYDKPYPQLLVSDGSWLWSWDEDLNQATRQALNDALGSSPAAVILGSGDLEESFTIKPLSPAEGLEWVEIIPKQNEQLFQRIELGFAEGLLRRMTLLDSFGQRSDIDFIHLKTNHPVPTEKFQFTPPAGADVIHG